MKSLLLGDCTLVLCSLRAAAEPGEADLYLWREPGAAERGGGGWHGGGGCGMWGGARPVIRM